MFNLFKETTPPLVYHVPERVRSGDDMGSCSLRGSVPHYWRVSGMTAEPGVSAFMLREFRDWLQEEVYGAGESGLAKLNAANGTDYTEWGEVMLPKEDFFAWRANTDYSKGFLKLMRDFKDSDRMIPLAECWPDAEGEFISMLKRNCGNSLDAVNAALGTHYNSWSMISIPEKVPGNPRLAEQWGIFLRTYINPEFLKIDTVAAQKPWELYLTAKYGSVSAAGKRYALVPERVPAYPSSEDPHESASESASRNDWILFVQSDSTPEKLWRSHLSAKYKTPAAVSKAYGVDYESFDDIPYPASEDGVSGAAKADRDELLKKVVFLREHELPLSALSIDTLANRYREFLSIKYPSGLPGGMRHTATDLSLLTR